jgi:hypothetical protein
MTILSFSFIRLLLPGLVCLQRHHSLLQCSQ